MSAGAGDKDQTTRAALALLVLAALSTAGCSAAPSSLGGRAESSYLGAAPRGDLQTGGDTGGETDVGAKVSASKVLSAIVFERVTGLEVDPARLVER